MKKNMVAFDCGNSSFRVLLGTYDGEKITTEVISQTPNYMVRLRQYEYWDILMIYHGLLQGLAKAVKRVGRIDSLGICTWGVDFALFDRDGNMLSNPLSYRNNIGEEMLSGTSEENQEALYNSTGVLCDKINSVYMLRGMKQRFSGVFEQGERLLMIPDILNYLFTGVMLNEPSELSTTQLMDARTRKISKEALDLMEIPQRFFGGLGEHGTRVGMLQREICESLGITYEIPVICVPSHDTAAAVLAIPSEEEESLFISSGTWALIGMELKEPVVCEKVKACGLTNEIGAFDRITLLKNSAGMFLAQRLKEEYEEEKYKEEEYKNEEYKKEAKGVDWEVFNGLGDTDSGRGMVFDVNDAAFFNPENMSETIWEYFVQTGQAKGPKNWAGIVRSFQISIACSFAVAVEDLEQVIHETKDCVYMVGGGSRNQRICQLTADLTGRCIVTGGGESTSIGNLLAQIKYFEPEKDIEDLRKIVSRSIDTLKYNRRQDRTEILRKYQTLLG